MDKNSNWFRISEWWNSKIVSLMGLAYFLLLFNTQTAQEKISVIIFLLIWMFASAALGYYVNDVFDCSHDLVANKYNFASLHTIPTQVIIVAILLVVLYLDWQFLSKNEFVSILIFVQVLLYFLYSSPYFRFKENPVLGIVTDALYAHLIPGIIVYYSVFPSPEITAFIVVFLLWLLLQGLRNILSHQISDYSNDKVSGTISAVVFFGKSPMKWLMNYTLLPMEILMYIVLFIQKHQFGLIVHFLAFITWAFYRELVYVRENKHCWTSEEQESYTFLGGVVPNEYYEKWFPLFTLVLLVVKDWGLWYIAPIHVLFFFRRVADFEKDYLILKNLILKKVYWKMVSFGYRLITFAKEAGCFFYYKIFCKVKHIVYWKIYHLTSKRNG